MKTLETERLILRKFLVNDFEAVHSYASCMENIIYMPWGPNTEEQTREFIDRVIKEAEEVPCVSFIYAITLKKTGKLIGCCDISVKEEKGSLGWIIHRDYWKQGYGTEAAGALLKYGFTELNLHRITASCNCENTASSRVMEKNGMRREAHFLEINPPHKMSDKKFSDAFVYAILKDEWETQNEIAFYNSLPVKFDGFIDLPELSDNEIHLVCTDKKPGIPEKKWVPAYEFVVCKGSEKIGNIALRIGYTDGLYYGGQIGYNIDEKFRGRSCAGRACRLLPPVARAHDMTRLLITNNQTNNASRRVCEKLGLRLVRVARLPEWHDLYKNGQRFQNIFEWVI